MSALKVKQLDAPFGAEVHGVKLDALDEDAVLELQRAFDEHGLLVIRDPELEYPTQQKVVEMLVREDLSSPDELDVQPSAYVSNREEGASSAAGLILFHTDGMWSREPFKLVSLYAVQVDPGASPTRFAGMASAWDSLPDDLRARVEGLHVVQAQGTLRGLQDGDEKLTIDPNAKGVSRVTPIAQAHPRTGRPVLYVSEQQTREIVEVPGAEGDALLDQLLDHLYQPENMLEHEWRDGDLVAWDNLAVQHARPEVTMDGPARTLRRAVVPPPWMWAGIQEYAASS
jgi:alpha-ketoglutarate-dependent taurine dioxygenase